MLIDWSQVNFLAIIAGGLLYIMYGAIYYSVLLSNKNGNKDIVDNQTKGPLKYIVSVIIAFISSFFVAMFIRATGSENWVDGAGIGLIMGILISLVYLKNSLFGLMSRKSFFIAIGDHLIIFTLLGILHGLML